MKRSMLTTHTHSSIMRSTNFYILLVLICLLLASSCQACQSCFWPRIPSSTTTTTRSHPHITTAAASSTTAMTNGPTAVAIAVARQRQLFGEYLRVCLERMLQTVTLSRVLRVSAVLAVAVAGGIAVERWCGHVQASPQSQNSRLGIFMKTASSNKKENCDTESKEEEPSDDGEASSDEAAPKEPSELSSAMIATIGVYKNFISPLLPPACRFLPTCSQYGVQAIQEFGPCKGVILTSWRLLRCSPLGGKGYDPPKWPPVPYTYSSY